jgi:hypothetical protein
MALLTISTMFKLPLSSSVPRGSRGVGPAIMLSVCVNIGQEVHCDSSFKTSFAALAIAKMACKFKLLVNHRRFIGIAKPLM